MRQQLQQNDPIAQAMQLLQFITQRRGQQAGIEQGNRGLDLREQELQQRQSQFDAGFGMDTKRFDAEQARFQQQFQDQQVQRALDEAFRQNQLGATMGYQNAIAESARENALSSRLQREAQAKDSATRLYVDSLQNRMQFARSPQEAMAIQKQIDQYLQERYALQLPAMPELFPGANQFQELLNNK